MFPARLAPVLFGLFVSVLMSCIISGVATLRAVGLADDFLNIWMSSWLFSWMIAFPTILFVAPLARRLVGRLTRPGSQG